MTSNRASRRLLTVAGITVCLAGVARVVTGGQSLGEVARQEAERRQATPAGKTYTNADLKPVEAPAPSAAPAGQAAGSQPAPARDTPDAASAATPEAGESKKDEAYWRGRMKAAREGKARAESFAEALQTRINSLSADFVNRDDPAQRATIATDRQKALDELARVQKEIREHTASITDIQTEARRDGVPAGWVR